MSKLVETQKPYKYLINTLITQRKGANLSVATSSLYDSVSDQSMYVYMYPK